MPANLSTHSDALNKSQTLKIKFPVAPEQVFRTKLAEIEAKKWKQNNKKAIQAYNDMAEEHGLFANEHRVF